MYPVVGFYYLHTLPSDSLPLAPIGRFWRFWLGLNPPGTSGAGSCLPGASWGLLELYFDSSPPVASQIQGQARDETINNETIKTDNRGDINNQTRQSKTKIQGRPWTSWGGIYPSVVSFDRKVRKSGGPPCSGESESRKASRPREPLRGTSPAREGQKVGGPALLG